MSNPCMSPGDAFNAEAASIFGGIIFIIIVIALLGVVIAIVLGIAAVAMLIASLYFLGKKEYTTAGIYFLIGAICLPFAFGLYTGLDEWQKMKTFREIKHETLKVGNRTLFRLNNGQLLAAKSEYDAAMGKGRVLSEQEKKDTIRQMIEASFKEDGDTCHVDISRRILYVYFHRGKEIEPWCVDNYISGCYITFQDCLGLTELDPVTVRFYRGRRLVAKTGKLIVWDASNKYFYRKEYKLQLFIKGKCYYVNTGSVETRKNDH